MSVRNPSAAAWLHRLDSYTNGIFGRARTLSAIRDECVACGERTTRPDTGGLCRRCASERVPDTVVIVPFAPPGHPSRAA